jgi:ribosomal RNA-processing protein 8
MFSAYTYSHEAKLTPALFSFTLYTFRPPQDLFMAPFHVPGWSMKNAPVSEQSSHLSKKRKRPSPRSIELESAEINFEKLVATLKDVKPDGNTSRSTDITGKRQKKRCRISEDVNISPSTNRKPVPNPPTPKNSSETFLKPNKQRKRKQDEPQNTSDSRLTALQKNMKQNLDGARFR